MDEDIRGHIDAGRFGEAFELLLDRYQRKVYRLAWSILGDESAAEEMAQDVFIQIWKALPNFRGEASLSTWIFAITRNRSLTRRRKIRSVAAASLEEPGIRAAAEARLAPRPETPGSPDLAAMLGQLPWQYRQALHLFYLEEKSYEEVAAMLGLPIGTVRTYLYRGRKQLAQMLVKVK